MAESDACNRLGVVEITVVQKLHQGFFPENGGYSFSGRLLVTFSVKSNKEKIV